MRRACTDQRCNDTLASRASRDLVQFSLFYFSNEASARGADVYRLLIEGARFADDNGLTAVWTPERHFHPFGGAYPNPAITGALVAALTSRVGVRAGSVVAPLHHPVRIAEEWAMVDNISHGRTGISFAPGWNSRDFVFTPGGYASRRDTTRDTIEIVRRLWSGEEVTLPDGVGEEIPVAIHPRPVQERLPIWLTSSGSPQTFEAAGELSGNVLTSLLEQDFATLEANIRRYRTARLKSGDGGGGFVTCSLHAFLGDDVGAVRRTVRGPLHAYLRSALDLIVRSETGLLAADLDEDTAGFFVDRAFERYFNEIGLFGPPPRCFELVETLAGIGVDEIACFIDFGVDEDAVLASLGHLRQLVERYSG
jgi:natural product biosynthesis luciferase-like monooxygenase protein